MNGKILILYPIPGWNDTLSRRIALRFFAHDTRAATKHTGIPHPRGGGARASRLTPSYVPCRPTACGTATMWCPHITRMRMYATHAGRHHSHRAGSWRTAVLTHKSFICGKASHKRLREGMPTCGADAVWMASFIQRIVFLQIAAIFWPQFSVPYDCLL